MDTSHFFTLLEAFTNKNGISSSWRTHMAGSSDLRRAGWLLMRSSKYTKTCTVWVQLLDHPMFMDLFFMASLQWAQY